MGIYTKQEEIINTIKVLRKEVEVLTKRVEAHATGHIITAIGVINGRIDELIGEAITPYFDNPDNNLSPRKLAGKIFDEDIYGNLEGQARLRKIQDKAAGRSTDDVEHTKEYYDTERNRAPSIQTMTSDGLSNRAMKQKYGQAVQTVSEMMQDELEPLPINTFE